MKKILALIVVAAIAYGAYYYFTAKTPVTTDTDTLEEEPVATQQTAANVTSTTQAQAEVSSIEKEAQSADLSALDEDFDAGLADAVK